MARNRGSEAMMDEALAESIPEEFQDMAKGMGLAKDVTMGEFMDHVRVHTHTVQPKNIVAYLAHFSGWDIALETEEEVYQGDRIGTVRVDGKKTPIFAHMGLSDLFDRTDPPLEQLFTKAAKGRKTAIVLQVMPRFFVDADAEGRMRSILIQGGWHFSGDVWHPFLLTQNGPDDLLAQRKFLKPGAPSRGLLRERGQDPEILRVAHTMHAAMRNRMHEVSGEASAQGEGNTKIGTGASGWSFFGNEAAWSAHQELTQSLAVPEMSRAADQDAGVPGDLSEMIRGAPESLVDLIETITPGPEEAESMLMHLAFLTDGLEGLDETVCKNLTPHELDDLIRCSTARIDPSEIAFWMHVMTGCSFDSINAQLAEGETEGAPELLRHGDVIGLMESGDGSDPIPVIFHGGSIDPTDPTSDFAFMVTRRAAQSRFDGKPVMVLPAALAARSAPGAKHISEGAGESAIAIVIGYVFDGREWRPALVGQTGSDVFKNHLDRKTLLPVDPSGYTGVVKLPDIDKGTTQDMRALSAVALFQQSIDRHHDLGPDYQRSEEMKDMQTAYGLRPWDDDWISFLDLAQEEVYGPGESLKN